MRAEKSSNLFASIFDWDLTTVEAEIPQSV
jgi:hypothetical protein